MAPGQRGRGLMHLQKKRPTSAERRSGPREKGLLAGSTYPEHATNILDLQVRRICRRFGISPAMARVIASLHFGEVRA